jgi:hypothetical protein
MLETSEKYLSVVKDAAAACGVTCDTVHVEHEHPYEAIYRHYEEAGVRPHRHGLARPARRFRHRARE